MLIVTELSVQPKTSLSSVVDDINSKKILVCNEPSVVAFSQTEFSCLYSPSFARSAAAALTCVDANAVVRLSRVNSKHGSDIQKDVLIVVVVPFNIEVGRFFILSAGYFSPAMKQKILSDLPSIASISSGSSWFQNHILPSMDMEEAPRNAPHIPSPDTTSLVLDKRRVFLLHTHNPPSGDSVRMNRILYICRLYTRKRLNMKYADIRSAWFDASDKIELEEDIFAQCYLLKACCYPAERVSFICDHMVGGLRRLVESREMTIESILLHNPNYAACLTLESLLIEYRRQLVDICSDYSRENRHRRELRIANEATSGAGVSFVVDYAFDILQTKKPPVEDQERCPAYDEWRDAALYIARDYQKVMNPPKKKENKKK